LREHFGPGYRIYFTGSSDGDTVLLMGGMKDTQAQDIDRARRLTALLD